MRREFSFANRSMRNEYQTLKGVCFFEARGGIANRVSHPKSYQTLKGVCFFEAICASSIFFAKP